MPNPTSYSWTTVGDIVAPAISRVDVIDAFTLRVIYTEAVEAAGALDPANYAFTGGLTAQSVTQETDATYIVTTSQQTAGVSYTLTVSNVTDTSGNPI